MRVKCNCININNIMVLCEACGSFITKVDKEKNESNRDRCWECVKMDLHAEEERTRGSKGPKEITEGMTEDEINFIRKQNKKVKPCDVSEEHIRRRKQWTTLRGNPYRSLAWTDESSEESEVSEEDVEEVDPEVAAMKAERKRKKAERRAEERAEKQAEKEKANNANVASA